MNTKEILSHVDHTLLKATATWEQIKKIAEESIEYGTASICIPQCYLKRLNETYGDKVFLSLMNQYTPLPQVEKYPEINRRVTEEEYEELVDFAIEIGVENGFIQEGETAEESFIPEFNNEGI